METFKHDIKQFENRFSSLRSQIHERERSELVGRRGHSSGNSDNPFANGHTQFNRDASTGVTRHQGLLNEHTSLQHTDNALDAFIAQGQAVLQNLSEQNYSLQSTQQKIVSVAETLGLSRSTIAVIERRTTQDTIIFWAGVIITLATFYYIYRLIRG